MPLDTSQKIAHLQAMVNKAMTGRTKTVVFVYNSVGVFSYVAQQVIFRPQEVIEPEIPDLTGAAPKARYDMLMIVPITVSMTGVVMVADTTTATSAAVASALKYEIVEAIPQGILPQGTHLTVQLRRYM